MANVVVDRFGRIVLPKKARDSFDTNVFDVEVGRRGIVLRPRPSIESVFGKFPEVRVDEFIRLRRREKLRESSS